MLTQDKLSSIVASQLPEHIRNNYPKFVRLIELYYEFLEQDRGAFEVIQNAKSYLDIDRTAADFVDYFLKYYATDIPNLALVDKSILIKNIHDLYESKGSELSFQLLFRLLYNEDVEIRYPYENVLKGSDGKWDQKISIHISKTFGDVDLLRSRIVVYRRNGVRYEFDVARLKNLNQNFCELFLNPKYNSIPFTTGDDIFVYDADDNVLFEGLIVPTVTRYLIVQSGLGFKVGQIISVNYGNAVDMLIKITGVSNTGAITQITIVNYGYGYDAEFSIELYNDLSFAVKTSLFLTRTNGFFEHINIAKIKESSNSDRYFEEDYVRVYSDDAVLPYNNLYDQPSNGYFSSDYTEYNIEYADLYQDYVAEESLDIFEDNSGGGGDFSVSGDPSVAVLQFLLGTKAKYPGQYVSYNGFLSEFDIKLQDDRLYQPFAYQVQTNIDISVFYDTVKKLVHQAGTNLFSNRTLHNVIDISADIQSTLIANVNVELHELISAHDSINILTNKSLIDSASTFDSINIGYLVSADEAVIVDDVLSFTLYQNITDNVNIFDNVTNDSINNQSREDLANVSELVSFTLYKNITDIVNIVDEASPGTSGLGDNAQVVDDITLEFYVSDYAPDLYFSGIYTGNI